MNHDALPNYLAMYRRRLGLSQEEVAHILGASISGTNVSRTETGGTFPTLKTLLKYEILYGVGRGALFEGLTNEVREEMLPNIRGLLRRLEKKVQTKTNRAKIDALKAILLEDNPSST